MLVNESDNLLYVVESQSTGSKVYYFDLNTLNVTTETQGYGYSNNNRTAFFDGYNLYTLNFKIDKLNAHSILGEYDYGSIGYKLEYN